MSDKDTTVLFEAARYGSVNAAKILIDAGADLDVRGPFRTPLEAALTSYRTSYYRHGARVTLLQR